ncbi:helix-turn-helix transcriptional regulator [Shimia thalassica]|uniref:helix-turn-helix transcriptional regulator n=1 Tax=Shimia thalassica TaxID=1715693 RepID=UPI002734FAA1|nr:helix-turn-helix transcriptional regulator [Shimia thalassica]
MSASAEKFMIRAGAFHGPTLLLSDSIQGFHKTLQTLDLSADAEEIIDVSSYLKGLRKISRLAGDDDFFVWAGFNQKLEDLGFFGRATVSADTLWDAFQITKSALDYIQSESELVIRVYNGRCHIWYFEPFNAHEGAHDVQYTIGLLANIVCRANSELDPDIKIAYPNGSLTHFPAGSPIAEVRNSKQGYISFDDRLLKSGMVGTDVLRAEVLSRYLDAKFIRRDQNLADLKSLTKDVVAGLVRASFGVAPWTLANTSQALQTHERTIQLRLKAEGTSFREIVQTERHDMSKRLLLLGKSIEETAEALGFDHRQSFSEAFSGWEGISPSAFVKAHHSQRAEKSGL